MSLRNLLGLPATVGNESLPAFLNRTTRAPAPRPDPVEQVLSEHREHARRETAADVEELRVRLIARRHQVEASAVSSRDPLVATQDAARRHKATKQLDELERQLTNGDYR